MNAKAKGSNAERELIHLFWQNGWAAFRAAGSGSVKYPVPDIIAGNGLRKIAIECKACKSRSKYFEKKEIQDIEEFGRKFGAEAMVSVKFNNLGTFFLKTNELQETEKSFMITAEVAMQKGKKFEELIK